MERVWSTLHRGFSVQSILTFVLTVFIAALLLVTFGSHTAAHAVDAPAATWKGASILYDGHQYFSAGDVKAGDSIGLPVGTHYYFYTPDPTVNTQQVPKAFVIYFTSGTDPPKEKTATFAVYDYSSTNVFSNQTDKKTINTTPQGNETSVNSCTIQGIGWIICPITTFLADGMDFIFNIVKGFLVVQSPNTTNSNNSLYIAWNVMRSIANVAFIIVFLIIIYSQLTNAGVSNYGLKKLLPRLIIAAILVNVSYLICAIALDISNILGYSLQSIFNTIRQNTFNINNDTWANSDGMGWSAITAFVLSGGAATVGVLIATGGTIAGAIYLLVPLLLGFIVTILLVLLILAARQAIIIILIVVAPLAFVAYLLPNTEQWFKKWRDLFMTMLVFFPAFSLVFGGSQLAGGIIIQNAGGSIMTVIFGMAVQVAPLIITPLLLKLSGGLLGKIAGIVNNPKKGLLDRTKAWSGDRAAMHRQRGVRDNNLRWYNGARRVARALDNNNRRVKDRTSNYTNEADNRYHRTPGYDRLNQEMFATDQEKNIIENTLKERVQQQVNSRGSDLHIQNLRLEDLKQRVEVSMKETETQTDEYQSGRVVVTGELGTLMHSLHDSHEALALSAIRRKSANDVTNGNWTARFIRDEHLQILSGGVGGQKAANVALASAIATEYKAYDENVSAARSLASHFNLSVEKRNELAHGNTVTGTNANGIDRLFTAGDAFTREVAIVDTIKAAPYGMGRDIIELSGTSDYTQYRSAIAEAMETGGWEAKGAFFDGETRDAVRQGDVNQVFLKQRAAEFLVNGKLSAELMATTHKGSLQTYIEAATEMRIGTITVADNKFASGNLDPTTGSGDINVALARVKTSAGTAISDGRIQPRIGDREDAIKDIRDNI